MSQENVEIVRRAFEAVNACLEYPSGAHFSRTMSLI